jgi:hypothetical protein
VVAGVFLRVLFPTSEDPRRPGLPHIGYVVTGSRAEVIVAYTTSQPWPSHTPLPAGVRLFTYDEAARLNQSRGFLLRLDVIARLPLTSSWFPGLDAGEAAIIAVAPMPLQRELRAMAENLARRRRDLIQMRGP